MRERVRARVGMGVRMKTRMRTRARLGVRAILSHQASVIGRRDGLVHAVGSNACSRSFERIGREEGGSLAAVCLGQLVDKLNAHNRLGHGAPRGRLQKRWNHALRVGLEQGRRLPVIPPVSAIGRLEILVASGRALLPAKGLLPLVGNCRSVVLQCKSPTQSDSSARWC